MIVNAVIEAADVDLGKGALLLALRCPDGETRRVSLMLRDDPEEVVPRSLGAKYLTQIPGRAVRVKLDGETIQDIGHFIEEKWLVSPTEAEELEKDTRTEP